MLWLIDLILGWFTDKILVPLLIGLITTLVGYRLGKSKGDVKEELRIRLANDEEIVKYGKKIEESRRRNRDNRGPRGPATIGSDADYYQLRRVLRSIRIVVGMLFERKSPQTNPRA
jgi:hypothetical protein